MANHTPRPLHISRGFQVIACVTLLASLALMVSCASHETAADFEPEWEKLVVEVARFHKAQPTGVAVSSDGRVFVNFPYWDRQPDICVAELDAHGFMVPFPTKRWNHWDGKSATSALRSFVSAQALYVDEDDFLWALDSGSPRKESGAVIAGPKLFKIDLSDNSIAQVFYFDQKRDLAPNSFLSDFRVDTDRHVAYITDSGRGGIMVYDLKTREARNVLVGHESTRPQDGVTAQIGSHPWVNFLGQRPSYGVAGVELSKDKQWLYYHALCGRDLYRVSTDALLDKRLSPGSLGMKVEHLGSTGSIVDGMWLDDNDNLYLTAVEKDAILVRRPTGEIETFVADERLQWPDSLAMGKDGYLYFTTSMRHLQSPYRLTDVKTQPYFLMKVSVDKVQRAVDAKRDAQFAMQSAAQAARDAVQSKRQALQRQRQADIVRAAAAREARRVASSQQRAEAAALAHAQAASAAEQAAHQQIEMAAQARRAVALAKAQLADAQAAAELARQAALTAKALANEARAKSQAGQLAKAEAIELRRKAQAVKAAFERAAAQAKLASDYVARMLEQMSQQQDRAGKAQQDADTAAAEAYLQTQAAEQAQASAQFARELAKQAQQQAYAAEHAELSNQADEPSRTVEVETQP